ncbi:MAG: GCN5-related N-acetyltransferase [Thermoleophilia bacterium]|nr:GCN5-related N-acetyltransferase [Thermoleophilia bacterium]
MLRPATPDDAAAIAAIYAPYVTDSVASFEEEPPTAEQFAARMAAATCWLVAERGGAVVGYAYAGPFHTRAAYRWSQEVSIYLDASVRRQGVGAELLDAVLVRLRALGMANAMAGISLPNPGSVGLFESRGFRKVAHYERIGSKLDRWVDVGWWQLDLRTAPDGDVPPQPSDTA